MSDRFQPISMEQLTRWVFTELERRDSLFNIPRRAFFAPRPDHRYRLTEHGVELDTPFGVAAGPHTQLAQNIVAAWLVGARVIELKTVQTLDQIEVHKPCIDVEDEGYNVEWSQELRVHQSFDEYLRAWVLIHALHRRLGWPGERPGVLFNMSVGYDYAGIQQPNVQWYLNAMADASAWLPAYVDIVAQYEPAVREIRDPDPAVRHDHAVDHARLPPGEIEEISRYLIEERNLQTSVKCNPTLLGADRVRRIVNDDLGYLDVQIPDEAFGHDLAWADAVPMFGRLREASATRGLTFGLKLSNTLEVENGRRTFDRDDTMYLSGRALHAVTTNLASAVAEEFSGDLPLSFAGGADAFNVAHLLGSGVRTVTVASDLLKTGGYLRLLQYTEQVDAAFDEVGALDTTDFIRRTAAANGFAGDTGDAAACARFNLRRYAESVRTDWRYQKASFRTDRSKTVRPLGTFDCIEAPCIDMCAIDQQVPRYMDAVGRGDVAEAVRVVREDNPLPIILGRVCDHLCENTCVRTHLDQPLAIRQIKRFIMDREGTDPDLPNTRAQRGGASGGDRWRRSRRACRRRGTRTAWRRGHHLRGPALRGRHGRKRDPGLPAAGGPARAGPGPRGAAGRGDPLLDARRDRCHDRRSEGGRLRGGLRGHRGAGRSPARASGRRCGRDPRRHHVPARRARRPSPERRSAGRRHRRRRHSHGLHPDRHAHRCHHDVAHLSAHRRPDAGGSRGDPRHPRGGRPDRGADAAGRGCASSTAGWPPSSASGPNTEMSATGPVARSRSMWRAPSSRSSSTLSCSR